MKSYIVVGLGFGDEGKGATVDHIASSLESSLVVRFNGGAQCAHNVVAGGKHHTFSQFGSNSFNKDSSTLFAETAYFNPLAYLQEREKLKKLGVEPHFYLSENCWITTPWHMALNRIKEIARGAWAHGSKGMGIGETVMYGEDNLVAGDITYDFVMDSADGIYHELKKFCLKQIAEISAEIKANPDIAKELDKIVNLLLTITPKEFVDKMKSLPGTKCSIVTADQEKEILSKNNLIFEGAQGVLLDQDFGFHPHTTWSNTTDELAWKLLAKHGLDIWPKTIGVLRMFHTRHGNGPFPSENAEVQKKAQEIHNGHSLYTGHFRWGLFDSVLANYALSVTRGVQSIAWTHLDMFQKEKTRPPIVTGYKLKGKEEFVRILNPRKYRRAPEPKYTNILGSVEELEYGNYTADELIAAYAERNFPAFSTATGPDRKDRKFA